MSRRIEGPEFHRNLSQAATGFQKSNQTGRWKKSGAVPVIFLLLGLLFGCESSARSKSDDPVSAPTVAVVKAERRDLSSKLELASELLPFQEIDMYAKVSGYIKKLYVDWGTPVKQGQMLAVMEIPELQQQLLQDEAAVRRSEQDLLRLREDLNRSESAYNVAHLSYMRLADVQKVRPELVAQQEVDIAQGKDLEARASVSGAKASLAGAEQALVSAKAALEKDKAMYAYANISAPFDGVVTHIYAYTGALLPAGTSSNSSSALLRLSQNNRLRLVIPVPERAVARIHLGDSVAIQVTALNKAFTGKIARFSNQIDRQTRTLRTEVDVPNSDHLLVSGMYATAQIPLQRVQNVLTLPVQAVQTTGSRTGSVLVVNAGNTIEKRDVALGLQTEIADEIESGLNENEMVVFGEQSQLKTGQRVTPKIVEPLKMKLE